MTIGYVYYADDPERRVFRKVLPNYALGETDAVLDDPTWVTLGCDPARKAVMAKVGDCDPLALPRGMSGNA